MNTGRSLAPKVWLVTTNDNLRAQPFYQGNGGALVAVHVGAVAHSRTLKPSIPTHGQGGLPISDELQYEWSASEAAQPFVAPDSLQRALPASASGQPHTSDTPGPDHGGFVFGMPILQTR